MQGSLDIWNGRGGEKVPALAENLTSQYSPLSTTTRNAKQKLMQQYKYLHTHGRNNE
jgi:hypothetical protein